MELLKFYLGLQMFFTYEQQLENLKNNGLNIINEESALECLKKEGYYNLVKGYSRYFKENDKYIKDSTFDGICSLYKFDKNVSAIIFKYTSVVENNVKVLLAHEFSKKYGEDHKLYLKAECFSNEKNMEKHLADLILRLNDTISDGGNRSKNRYRVYIEHYIKKDNKVPLWVLVRALTFGTISIFIGLLKDEDKTVLANEYKLTNEELVNMLDMLVQFRNIVAHGEKLFSNKIEKLRLNSDLIIFKKMSMPVTDKGYPKFGNRDFLSLLIIMKYFLDPLLYAGMITEIICEVENLKNRISPTVYGIIMQEMGLKIGSWKVLPKIKFN